jgi:hypothetical protein
MNSLKETQKDYDYKGHIIFHLAGQDNENNRRQPRATAQQANSSRTPT